MDFISLNGLVINKEKIVCITEDNGNARILLQGCDYEVRIDAPKREVLEMLCIHVPKCGRPNFEIKDEDQIATCGIDGVHTGEHRCVFPSGKEVSW